MPFRTVSVRPTTPNQPAKPTAENRLAVSAEEAAIMLNVCTRTVRNLAKRGEIRSKRIGSRVVFPVASLLAFIDGQPVE